MPGNLDGVHLGHRALLARAQAVARETGLVVRPLFFFPHPITVLKPELDPPALLTTEPRRRELLKAFGEVQVLAFDNALAALSASRFTQSYLREKLSTKALVLGPDFGFGKNREGNAQLLREMGFRVEIVPPVEEAGDVVSSSLVRQLIQNGDVARASKLLARPHDIDGCVETGQALARTLGFPTANIGAITTLIPKDGVYAVRIYLDQETYFGVANIGNRPTVRAGRAVEVHIFDFDRDIYGVTLRVAFLHRLRDETRFDGIEALKRQITADVAHARKVCKMY